jgi:hypothetical protein
MAEATALFGEFSAAARPAQYLWMVYQWRLGRPRGALEWLAARERYRSGVPTDPGAPVMQATRAFDIRDLAIEARLWMAAGEPDAAAAALQRGWALVPPERHGGDSLLLALIELEWAQRTRPPGEVLQRLGQRPWTDLQAGMDADWPVFPLWHRGLALGRMGDHAGSLTLLESALQTGRQVWGDGHPRTALIRLSLAWARWRAERGSPEGRAAAITILNRAIPDLDRGFPPDHPAVREARVFLAHLRGAPATKDDQKRWQNPDSTLFF